MISGELVTDEAELEITRNDTSQQKISESCAVSLNVTAGTVFYENKKLFSKTPL